MHFTRGVERPESLGILGRAETRPDCRVSGATIKPAVAPAAHLLSAASLRTHKRRGAWPMPGAAAFSHADPRQTLPALKQTGRSNRQEPRIVRSLPTQNRP